MDLRASRGPWGQTYDCLRSQCLCPLFLTQPSSQQGNVFLKSSNLIFGEMTSIVVTIKATRKKYKGQFVRLLKGHALEQRHHPEGLCGLHQEAAAGAAEGQGAGEPAEEAGARQPTPDAEDTGKLGSQKTQNQQRLQLQRLLHVCAFSHCRLSSGCVRVA